MAWDWVVGSSTETSTCPVRRAISDSRRDEVGAERTLQDTSLSGQSLVEARFRQDRD